ncbi:TetR/AcrR family transcriptional regulator [uncultured Tateyamaria sp.]|uniref:TetR/AcrR family transcriptional regulator n=1 Tax=Tateyamaria sp. 1078 TaxID=3417464 RepID=UPI0026129155|nr:TetR/AcrR family transcriptional regulator [uncultured Tateyamaria sp.]
MPRLSEAEKRKSHARILDAAADLFRERGIETTSVSEVMQAAGMTHGGFYRHFKGKEALVAAGFERAVDTVVADMEQPETDAAKGAARDTYIDTYLSMGHVNDRRHGCPMAALGSELSRASGEPHARAADAVERVSALLRTEEADDMSDARLALLVGAVTLARLTDDDARAADILAAARTAIARF